MLNVNLPVRLLSIEMVEKKRSHWHTSGGEEEDEVYFFTHCTWSPFADSLLTNCNDRISL